MSDLAIVIFGVVAIILEFCMFVYAVRWSNKFLLA